MSDPAEPGPGEPGEITQLLQAASQGRKEAFDRVLPLIYQELNRIARNRLRLVVGVGKNAIDFQLLRQFGNLGIGVRMSNDQVAAKRLQ